MVGGIVRAAFDVRVREARLEDDDLVLAARVVGEARVRRVLPALGVDRRHDLVARGTQEPVPPMADVGVVADRAAQLRVARTPAVVRVAHEVVAVPERQPESPAVVGKPGLSRGVVNEDQLDHLVGGRRRAGQRGGPVRGTRGGGRGAASREQEGRGEHDRDRSHGHPLTSHPIGRDRTGGGDGASPAAPIRWRREASHRTLRRVPRRPPRRMRSRNRPDRRDPRTASTRPISTRRSPSPSASRTSSGR